MNTEKIFNKEQNRTDYDMLGRRLRKSQIFYHKNLTLEQATYLFDNAINLEMATRIVTPNLDQFVFEDDGVRLIKLGE